KTRGRKIDSVDAGNLKIGIGRWMDQRGVAIFPTNSAAMGLHDIAAAICAADPPALLPRRRRIRINPPHRPAWSLADDGKVTKLDGSVYSHLHNSECLNTLIAYLVLVINAKAPANRMIPCPLV